MMEVKVHVGRGNSHIFGDLNPLGTVQEAIGKIATKLGLVNDGRYGLRPMRSQGCF